MIRKTVAHLALIFVLTASCNTNKPTAEAPVNTDINHFNFTVEEAPEWSKLFKRTSGWFGGDGIFAIPVNGIDKPVDTSATYILFSDTMVGDVENDKLKPGYVMIHNSVATLKGGEPKEENLQFSYDKKADGKPESVFIPSTPNTNAGDYYWLGDGFVNHALNDNTYIFGYRIRDVKTNNNFGFEHVGSTLIIIPKGSKPPFKDQRQIDIPLFVKGSNPADPTAYGCAIFDNSEAAQQEGADGYVYVYGIKGKDKQVVAARVKPDEFEHFDKWNYYDGSNWSADINKAAAIANHSSNEMSVSRLKDGRYAMFFQVDGVSTTVGMRLGTSPVGPFGPIIKVFDSKDAITSSKFFTYNAKAHPALSKPGEILVTYNVNSFDFFNDIKKYPNLYRPRFIKLRY